MINLCYVILHPSLCAPTSPHLIGNLWATIPKIDLRTAFCPWTCPIYDNLTAFLFWVFGAFKWNRDNDLTPDPETPNIFAV